MESHEDLDLDKFNDLVDSKKQRQQLSMYDKRHKS